MKVIVGLAQGMLPQQWMALMFEYGRVIRVDI
jgi:hypothetical protein